MWYFLLALVLVLVTMLCIRLRVRLIVNDTESIFFAGYGRTGYRYDFKTEIETIVLCGIPIKQLTKSTQEQKPEQRSTMAIYRTGYTTVKGRANELKQFAAIIPQSGKAVARFGWTILKRLTLEECELHITAGFDSPDTTGRTLGWYYSLVGAVASLRGKLFFTPVWDRQALDASGRLALSIPVYKLIGPVVRLIRDIPWRQIKQIVNKNPDRRPIWKTT